MAEIVVRKRRDRMSDRAEIIDDGEAVDAEPLLDQRRADHPGIVGQLQHLAADRAGEGDRQLARAGDCPLRRPNSCQAVWKLRMLGGLERDRLAERDDPAAVDLGEREARMGPADIGDGDLSAHACSASIAASIADAPASASFGVACASSRTARARCRRAAAASWPAAAHARSTPTASSVPRARIEPDDVAVAHARERPAGQRLGRDVDRGRHLAARARHAPVGDQRDLEAAVLQHAERRRQLVQLGHAVGARALEAHDHRRRRGRARRP